ncbi:MAG: DUF4276 family protein [Chryseobacterium sp.]|nr:MAG: DUF4276 family protein [Chryseobacterium sp.]
MRRLVFLVEGDTEIIFIEQHVIPYLYNNGFQNPMNVQKIVTNRKLHKKGGNVNYEYLKNDVKRIIAQGNVIITTFLDFFRLPNSFPGYTINSLQINNIEQAMLADLGGYDFILPYIQRHEIEALMFSAPEGINFVIDKQRQMDEIAAVMAQYNNPEDINSTPQGAPSKRLEQIFGYDKIVDGELILAELGIDVIIEKCPRFAVWISRIEQLLQADVN